jgi:hypothetical protein
MTLAERKTRATCVLPGETADKTCTVTPLHEYIRFGQDLYLGEGHGTAEVPALVRCLVGER